MSELNPLIKTLRAVPGTKYRLPSRGIFYIGTDILTDDVKDGELLIHPMNSLDEIAINTPGYLLDGTAIELVIKRCVPQVLKPKLLKSADVDYILTCLRIVTFGEIASIPHVHQCPPKEDGTVHEITPQVHKVSLSPIIATSQELDPIVWLQESTLTTAEGQTVTFEPMSYQTSLEVLDDYARLVKEIATMADRMQYTEDVDAEQNNIDQLSTQMSQLSIEYETEKRMMVIINNTLKCAILSVDGIQDKSLIEEWLTNIPISTKRMLSDRLMSFQRWGIKTSVESTCDRCQAKVQLEVSTNPATFFMEP